MENFVSIIIPVYTIDNKFKKNFKNLINQTYKNFEIILIINNENNLSILKKLTNDYKNINIICRDFDNNASAWNYGLKKSLGDYILFLKQHDYINKITLEKFLWNANIPFDMISSNYMDKNDLFYDFNNDYLFENLITNYDNLILDEHNIYTAIFKISNHINTKLFNKKFLIENNIIFESHTLYYEELFYYSVCFCANEILIINNSDLNLFLIESTENNYSDNFSEYQCLIKTLIKNFEKNTLYKYLKNTFTQILLIHMIKQYYKLNDFDKSKFFIQTKKLLLHYENQIMSDATSSLKILFNNFIYSNDYSHELILNKKSHEMFRKKTKISIIIPIFRNSKYIPNCLDSLLNQTLKEIEIICIEDRGNDDSYDIIKEYAKKDNRIKIRSNSQSKGFGFSKNIGLQYAIGEYILFIDVKNIIPSDRLEKIYYYAKQQKCEMLVCPVIKTAELIKNKSIFDFHDVFNNYSKHLKDMIFSTNTLYKHSFLNKMDINFYENTKLEDALFFVESLLNTERVSVYQDNCYYLHNRHFNWKYNFKYFILFFDDIFKIFKNIDYFSKYKNTLIEFKIEMCYFVFNKLEEKKKYEFYRILHDDFIKLDSNFKYSDEKLKFFVETIKKYKTFEEYNLSKENINITKV